MNKAQECKNKGNKYYKGGKYDQAIKCYTESIETCPAKFKKELATYYQNRAAAHEQLVRHTQFHTNFKINLQLLNRENILEF